MTINTKVTTSIAGASVSPNSIGIFKQGYRILLGKLFMQTISD